MSDFTFVHGRYYPIHREGEIIGPEQVNSTTMPSQDLRERARKWLIRETHVNTTPHAELIEEARLLIRAAYGFEHRW